MSVGSLTKPQADISCPVSHQTPDLHERRSLALCAPACKGLLGYADVAGELVCADESVIVGRQGREALCGIHIKTMRFWVCQGNAGESGKVSRNPYPYF